MCASVRGIEICADVTVTGDADISYEVSGSGEEIFVRVGRCDLHLVLTSKALPMMLSVLSEAKSEVDRIDAEYAARAKS
ncbi:hypothetical protein LX15_005944 [Streptoalloteichus tenebrarius]|uniref:Polyhydroxyalkanoic acid synthase n=1 Tax=Streptoalloteichus tenebrarius (strain ATCC 17920 / DSM 40477 / JCM 4838 / CBS 697.72 / NBRC 16177 / NCIMB 11028 / NRRL B-12390 / A12253. 1 / ISP 5477) TaxID=1933 RepID=A0ABT1I383_STRSD|nr:hypothetical protein [Streptoalloteichus tenebrarius]MCP2262210.1 hypothetical protein [Streptoalloteichus tenebrarius]BFF01074.1 hypothetical protein GCM10020241_27490 [Streptoalloteichus tenebrarius]